MRATSPVLFHRRNCADGRGTRPDDLMRQSVEGSQGAACVFMGLLLD